MIIAFPRTTRWDTAKPRRRQRRKRRLVRRSERTDAELLNRGVGIRFNGAEKTNVEEYCISEGWVRVAVGKTLDRKGNPLTIKLQGKVEPYVKDQPAEG